MSDGIEESVKHATDATESYSGSANDDGSEVTDNVHADSTFFHPGKPLEIVPGAIQGREGIVGTKEEVFPKARCNPKRHEVELVWNGDISKLPT